MAGLASFTPSQPRFSFRIKLALVILGVSAVVAGVTAGVLMSVMRSATRSTVSVAMGTAAVHIAMDLDHADVLSGSAGDGAARERLRARMGAMRDRMIAELRPLAQSRVELDAAMESAYLASIDRGTGVCTVFASVGRVPAGARFPLPVAATGADALAGLVIEPELSRKPQGLVLSAFAPVRGPGGATAALLGMDASSRYFEFPYRESALFGLSIFAAALLIGVPGAWYLSARMNRPVRALHDGMQRLAMGDLAVRLSPRKRGDEFDALMRRFNRMAAGLGEREEMRRSLETASTVQRHLLPQKPPSIPGYRVLAAVRYCDQTGGDYVDCFPLLEPGAGNREARRWGLAVGDVTGHGIAAALLMTWTRSLVRAVAPLHADDLARLVRSVNHHLRRDSEEGTFLTLFYGTLEPREHLLNWSSAGHEPAVVVAAGGHARLLKATDMPLGVDDGASFDCGEPVRLGPGDTLLIATDGLTQARCPEGEFFGSDRIADLMRAHAAADLDTLRDAIFAAVDAHRAGATQDDDITFLVIRRNDS